MQIRPDLSSSGRHRRSRPKPWFPADLVFPFFFVYIPSITLTTFSPRASSLTFSHQQRILRCGQFCHRFFVLSSLIPAPHAPGHGSLREMDKFNIHIQPRSWHIIVFKTSSFHSLLFPSWQALSSLTVAARQSDTILVSREPSPPKAIFITGPGRQARG